MISEGTGMKSPISVDLARNVHVIETWCLRLGRGSCSHIKWMYNTCVQKGARGGGKGVPVTGSTLAVVSLLVYLCFPEVLLQI